jgi:Mg2+-importing ATPase
VRPRLARPSLYGDVCLPSRCLQRGGRFLYKIPFVPSRASKPLIVTSLLIVAAGALLPFSPLANLLGFVPLPWSYWPWLAGMLAACIVLTQIVKIWFIRRFGE